jgi:hypothetical protein
MLCIVEYLFLVLTPLATVGQNMLVCHYNIFFFFGGGGGGAAVLFCYLQLWLKTARTNGSICQHFSINLFKKTGTSNPFPYTAGRETAELTSSV